MAQKNTLNLNVSIDELKKNIDSPESFKKYFEENSYEDDSVTPFNLPFDGEKNILIQRWINTDFNEWWAAINQWDGHKFDPVQEDNDWVKVVKEALPDEDAK